MTAAYIVVVALALVLQVLFSALYWKWIPAWVRNPYGRLAQFDAWCRILVLSMALAASFFGWSNELKTMLFTFAFLPLVFYGGLQLVLLWRAAFSGRQAKEEGTEQ